MTETERTGEALIEGATLSARVRTGDRYGWCGLEDLTISDLPLDWQLSPALTLEHYIGVPTDAPEYIEYEPCGCGHELYQAGSDGCTLVYRPLPCSRVETRIDYRIADPHSIDVHVQATTERQNWPYGSLALFFATVVKAPMYSGVTLLGEDAAIAANRTTPWLSFNGRAAVSGRTAHPSEVERPELGRPITPPDTYYYHDSSVRFHDPFYYGSVGRLIYLLMFPRARREEVRFTVNPLAPAFGGPAWDFFWIIERPVPGRAYSLDARIALLADAAPESILKEYNAYDAFVPQASSH